MKTFVTGIMLLTAVSFAGADLDYPKYVTAKTLYAKTDLRGKKAPDLEVSQWLTGKAPSIEGKVVVYDFWATWCGPCRELIPEMNSWQKKFGKDVVFIGISDEKAETVQDFMKKTKMEYNVAVDGIKRMSNVLGVQGIPHVMVVSPDGIVRWQGFPMDDKDKLTDAVLQQIIDASRAKN